MIDEDRHNVWCMYTHKEKYRYKEIFAPKRVPIQPMGVSRRIHRQTSIHTRLFRHRRWFVLERFLPLDPHLQ